MAFGVHLKTVTIGSGTSVSDLAEIEGLRPIGVIIGSGWTTGALYFSGTFDAVAEFNLASESGSLYSIATPTVDTFFPLRRSIFEGLHGVRIKSGSPTIEVNQVS